MATPFEHTHISYVKRTRRRRSQSVTIPNSKEKDAPEQSAQRKEFFAQLQNERQKQQSKHNVQNKEESENQEEHPKSKEDRYQPIVTRVPGTGTTMSMKKNISFTNPVADVLKKEVTSISSATTYSDENENHHKYQPPIVRIPRSDSKTSLSRKISTKTGKSSNITVVTAGKNSKLDSFTTLNGVNLGSSQLSTNPLLSSSTNLTSKSEIIDQNFHLDDIADHARRSDTKPHGKITISGPEKYYTAADRKLAAVSSASFMTAIIAIVIGVIAFAFGLTSLVLVLLLRSTVNAQLASNSNTTSNSSSSSSSSSSSTNVATWTAACSSYITVNDPTRSVYASGYALGCDNTSPFNQSNPAWIRFIGTGGTMLPLTTPGLNICGSKGTGWYYGTMPSSGQIVNGTACFTWLTSVCQYSQSISVANCSSFYIYLLPPAPACMMRYCTI